MKYLKLLAEFHHILFIFLSIFLKLENVIENFSLNNKNEIGYGIIDLNYSF